MKPKTILASRAVLLPILLCLPSAWAGTTTPSKLLEDYAAQAKSADPKFKGFSAERGNAFYREEKTHSDGKRVSCASCHTADPKNRGLTRANKEIEPLAPSANPERFTDSAKVEKWFGRNCKDVLERPCTPREKGDFIEYLRLIK